MYNSSGGGGGKILPREVLETRDVGITRMTNVQNSDFTTRVGRRSAGGSTFLLERGFGLYSVRLDVAEMHTKSVVTFFVAARKDGFREPFCKKAKQVNSDLPQLRLS